MATPRACRLTWRQRASAARRWRAAEDRPERPFLRAQGRSGSVAPPPRSHMGDQQLKSLRVVRADDGVAEVVLASGRPGNPMGRDFWFELPNVFNELAGDAAVRAIV